MTGIVLTQNSTFIIGDVARILGWIMNALFNFLDGVFGIQNIGLCIILFTIIIYLLMLPLTIKQQKFFLVILMPKASRMMMVLRSTLQVLV